MPTPTPERGMVPYTACGINKYVVQMNKKVVNKHHLGGKKIKQKPKI